MILMVNPCFPSLLILLLVRHEEEEAERNVRNNEPLLFCVKGKETTMAFFLWQIVPEGHPLVSYNIHQR